MAEKDIAFDDEADQTMTLKEYLNGVEEDELEADLVLGGDEGKECTYNKGYMKRQAIFSCLTCTPAGNAGFCTACSLNCHDGHEIVELWTKRNFRCDCGNSKFGEFYCKLFPGKDVENTENSYNHNFKGLYCTCNRPYPDPDIEEQEDMMQCCICEDWFHEEHIGLESPDEVPKDQEGEPLYEDFICQTCSASCSFLTLYPKAIFAAGSKRSTTGSASKDKAVQNDASSASASGKLNNDINSAGSSESAPGVKSNMPCKVSEKNVGSSQGAELSSNETCIIGLDLGANVRSLERSKPMFLSKSWRDAICRCVNCVELYRVRCVSFLLDKEDSISVYMRMAEQKREEKLQQQEVAELSMLNNLGHVEKIEILNGIADIRDEFVSFLESSDPSKPVTPEDVQQVFENLNRKRRRV